MSKLNIVLLEPEIPQNTGNIARTCAASGASLHMIKPFGFKIDDAKLKRAGMDYWYHLDIHYYENLDEFFEKNPNANFYLFTKKASKKYTDIRYQENSFLFFGRESCGLPEELLAKFPERCLRIPMRESLRSLNQSNSVAIAVYEVLRQKDFDGLSEDGGWIKNS
ncbi:MAG: tRNA (cytidine(34)-2'-O)-methyltransferase [Ruminococcaceae bacterium]|nr:tRNA (cytidine(34)-2'-O)-methyltransferase [Oscillospiraceae bacterium]